MKTSKANGGNKGGMPGGKTDVKAKLFGGKMGHKSPKGGHKTGSKAKTFGVKC